MGEKDNCPVATLSLKLLKEEIEKYRGQEFVLAVEWGGEVDAGSVKTGVNPFGIGTADLK